MKNVRVGDEVIVIGYEDAGRRVVQALLDDIPGGVVLRHPIDGWDAAVDGLRCWNEEALRCLKRARS